MISEINYTKLSERGLRDLINQDDDKALDEFTRRVMSGDIKRKRYKNVEELAADWAKRKKASWKLIIHVPLQYPPHF